MGFFRSSNPVDVVVDDRAKVDLQCKAKEMNIHISRLRKVGRKKPCVPPLRRKDSTHMREVFEPGRMRALFRHAEPPPSRALQYCELMFSVVVSLTRSLLARIARTRVNSLRYSVASLSLWFRSTSVEFSHPSQAFLPAEAD